LQKELQGLADLVALSRGELIGSARARKLRRLRLHRLSAADAVPDLHRAGRAIAAGWLARRAT